MRVDEAERTRGIRDKKEKKRADKEAARLQAQYVFSSCVCHMYAYSVLPYLFHALVGSQRWMSTRTSYK